MGFLGFDFLGGSEGTGDFYPLDSPHRVVAKLGTDRNVYLADQFGQSKNPEDNGFSWYQTDQMGDYHYYSFSVGNINITSVDELKSPRS